MVKIRVPDAHPVDHVALEGTHPNESASRIGAPRDAHVRIEADENLTLQIREDDDGRYVGAREQHADPIRRYFAAEYDAEYPELEDGDDAEDADPDSDTTDFDEAGDETGAAAVDAVQDAHWNTATTDIHEGAYDHALDALADADLSDAKAEAVDERRAELADE